MTSALLIVLAILVLGSILGSLHAPPPPSTLPRIDVKIKSIYVMGRPIEFAAADNFRIEFTAADNFRIEVPRGSDLELAVRLLGLEERLQASMNLTGILRKPLGPGIYRPQPKTFAELERERVALASRLRGPIHGEAC